MEILIVNNDAAGYIEAANKTLWRLSLKKSFLFYLLILVTGVVSLITGITQGHDNTTTSSEYFEDTTKVTSTTNVYFYHISFGLGIAFIFLLLYILYLRYRLRKSFFKEVKKICDRHKLANNDFTIRITDQSLYYQDFELTREEKWSVFSEYKVENGYLLLFRTNYLHTAFPIPIKQLTNNELGELLKLVKTRLLEKR